MRREREPVRCAGILLTGGSSRRMGVDKATLGDPPLAVRVADVLQTVAGPCVEVGLGVSGFPNVDDPRQGPLVAFVAGAAALPDGVPVLLVACDLPRLTGGLLRWLADRPGHGTVIPDSGRRQPLCARWSPQAVTEAAVRVQQGERSFRWLPADAELVTVPAALEPELDDVDTPEDWARVSTIHPDGP